MKKRYFGLISIALVAIFVLGACSSGTQATEVPVPTKAQETAVVQEPTAVVLTDAEMEALIAEKAHDQHTLDFILSKDMTAAEWSETLDRMIGYGAKISPEEKAMIIEWLVNRNK